MDKEWSEKNKKMQTLIAKDETFAEGIKVLLELRSSLFEQITSIVKTFPPLAFYQLPFVQGEGNHNATLAWSLWHLFRIEDVAAHTLILEENRKQYPEMNVQARFKIHGTRKIIACCNYGGLFSCCLK